MTAQRRAAKSSAMRAASSGLGAPIRSSPLAAILVHAPIMFTRSIRCRLTSSQNRRRSILTASASATASTPAVVARAWQALRHESSTPPE